MGVVLVVVVGGCVFVGVVVVVVTGVCFAVACGGGGGPHGMKRTNVFAKIIAKQGTIRKIATQICPMGSDFKFCDMVYWASGSARTFTVGGAAADMFLNSYF